MRRAVSAMLLATREVLAESRPRMFLPAANAARPAANGPDRTAPQSRMAPLASAAGPSGQTVRQRVNVALGAQSSKVPTEPPLRMAKVVRAAGRAGRTAPAPGRAGAAGRLGAGGKGKAPGVAAEV